MRQDEIWDADAARRYDTPGTGMFAAEVLGPTVDRLAELAGGGRALEFAIGTGRVAVPLAERGRARHRHRAVRADGRAAAHARSDEAAIPVVAGDMATTPGAGRVLAGLPRLQHHLQPADPGRAGRLLPQRRPAPRPRRPVRHRAVGAASCARCRPGSRPRCWPPSRATSGWTPTTCCTSRSSRTTSGSATAPAGPAVPQPAPLHLAGRAGPDGPAGRVRAGDPARGLVRRRVHRRVPLARLGLPAGRRRARRRWTRSGRTAPGRPETRPRGRRGPPPVRAGPRPRR